MPKKKRQKKNNRESTPLPRRLQTLLASVKARYESITHRIVYTAFDLASTLHIPLVDVVKTLLVKTEGGYALVLLSAAQQLDTKRFARVARVKKVSIPSEKELVKKFRIKKGGLSSFGSLYRIPVYIDHALAKRKKALFSLGSFRHSLLLSLKDFFIAEHPVVGVFGVSKKFKKPHARRKG
jgi:Ala-tRNA(Pro) deacylase